MFRVSCTMFSIQTKATMPSHAFNYIAFEVFIVGILGWKSQRWSTRAGRWHHIVSTEIKFWWIAIATWRNSVRSSEKVKHHAQSNFTSISITFSCSIRARYIAIIIILLLLVTNYYTLIIRAHPLLLYWYILLYSYMGVV